MTHADFCKMDLEHVLLVFDECAALRTFATHIMNAQQCVRLKHYVHTAYASYEAKQGVPASHGVPDVIFVDEGYGPGKEQAFYAVFPPIYGVAEAETRVRIMGK